MLRTDHPCSLTAVRLGRLMRFPFYMLASNLLQVQCAHHTPTPQPPARIEWYLASHEPLTYCPTS